MSTNCDYKLCEMAFYVGPVFAILQLCQPFLIGFDLTSEMPIVEWENNKRGINLSGKQELKKKKEIEVTPQGKISIDN